MKKAQSLAAFALIAALGVASRADAQATAPNAAAAARLAKLKARQDAILAAAKAKAAATPAATTAAPVATTPPVTATAAPTASAKPATSASASPSAKPATSAAPVASASASAAPATSAAVHPDTASIALDLDALKKTRPDRRHAEFLDLQARFGSLLADPRAVAELKQHGQRIAYLQRIRALGVKANDVNFVKSVDALITTEEARDANALNTLRTSALPSATATAATATATAVAVPVATAGGAK